MADEAFERWWAVKTSTEFLARLPFVKDTAREAWAAAVSRLQNPGGRPLREVLALAVLRGEGVEGPLCDLLCDQGVGPADVRERLEAARLIFQEVFSFLYSFYVTDPREESEQKLWDQQQSIRLRVADWLGWSVATPGIPYPSETESTGVT